MSLAKASDTDSWDPFQEVASHNNGVAAGSQRLESRPAMPNAATLTPSPNPASCGLSSLFGLDPRAAVLVILADLMIFGADVVSLGTLLPIAVLASGVLSVIVYKIQTHWFGDDPTSALIKALIVALLTAIPAPLSPLIALPGGVVGVARMLRRK